MNRKNSYPQRPATNEELARDVESVVQQLGSAWESQVDVIVILSPRNSGQLAMSSNASKLKIEHMLSETRRKLVYAHHAPLQKIGEGI